VSRAVGVHTITLGDTLLPLNTILRTGDGDPLDLANYTVTFKMEQQGGTSELSETSTGVTKHPTQTFTASTSTDLLTCNGHGVKEGDQIVVANSGGALPTGLSASTRYFAVNVTPNAFSLATVPDGAAIDITAAGSGTNTFYIVGSVQMDFAAANVDTAGIYHGWFVLDSGSEDKHMPEGDRHYEIRVVAIGN
jgi:hypothetical protein